MLAIKPGQVITRFVRNKDISPSSSLGLSGHFGAPDMVLVLGGGAV